MKTAGAGACIRSRSEGHYTMVEVAFDPQQDGRAYSRQQDCRTGHWYTLAGLEKPLLLSIRQSILSRGGEEQKTGPKSTRRAILPATHLTRILPYRAIHCHTGTCNHELWILMQILCILGDCHASAHSVFSISKPALTRPFVARRPDRSFSGVANLLPHPITILCAVSVMQLQDVNPFFFLTTDEATVAKHDFQNSFKFLTADCRLHARPSRLLAILATIAKPLDPSAQQLTSHLRTDCSSDHMRVALV